MRSLVAIVALIFTVINGLTVNPAWSGEKVPSAAPKEKKAASTAAVWRDKVVVIPLKGVIASRKLGGQCEAFIAAVERARTAQRIIVEIDSPGGVIDSCDRICAALIKSPVPTTALILRQAVSGGAMVATACREIYMLPGARIGDIQPMNMLSQQMDERSAEKIEADVRAIMAANAGHNGYPKVLLEAMVSRSFEVYEVKFTTGEREFITAADFALLKENQAAGRDKRAFAAPPRIISQKNKLLAIDAASACELGIAKKIVNSREVLFKELKLSPTDLVTAEIPAGELNPLKMLEHSPLSRGMTLALTIFLLVGVAGTLTEMHTPGFGIPGACGIIGFASFFYLLFSVGRAEWYELAIFVTGIILMVVEIVVLPGFGICGIAGALCLLSGVVLAILPDLHSDYLRNNFGGEIEFALIMALGVLVGGTLLLIYFINRAGKFPWGKQTFLETRLPDYRSALKNLDEAPPAVSPLQQLVGANATALTALRPAGKIILSRDRTVLDAMSAGDFLEKGTVVKITAAAENHIIVARASDDI